MDFEEVVLESKTSSETGQKFDEPVRGTFSKTVIGEDLRRAIVALRSVPRMNWSQDSVYEDGNDGHASTEYIWRATDLSRSSSFAAAMKLIDCNERTFLANNGAPKMVAASQMQNPSEIMRKDSFTVASKRLDRTSDSKCQIVEQSTTSVQMSLISREKRGTANGIGEGSSTSTPSKLAVSPAGIVMTKKPPPLPPKPSHLHKFKIKQAVTGKLAFGGERIIGGAKNLEKTDFSLNGTNLDVVDIYERSLDVLEKDDSDQEFEDLTSPRSDSPECLLEELLDSVPAEEFDTSECHITPSVFTANNRGTPKTDLSSFDNLGHKSNGAEGQDAKEVQNKQKKGCEPKFMLTSSAVTESSSRTNAFIHQRNSNLSLKPVYIHMKPVTRQLDFNVMKKIRSFSPPTECSSSSTLASEQPNVSSATVASDKELTPEDIFEEIMELLETRKEAHGKSSVQLPPSSDDSRDQTYLQHEPSNRLTCDYLLENEWLSMYCDQIQPETQREIITKGRINERTSDAVVNNTNSEPSKAVTDEGVFKCKQISEALCAGPYTTTLLPDGTALQRPNTRVISPDEKALQDPNMRLPASDGKATIISQDTLQATVKRKPVPPLREKVQTYTFAIKDSLVQDIKIAPTIKSKPLVPRKDPKIVSHGYSASNSPSSCSELKYEPVTAANAISENRRAANVSSAESNVDPCDENKRTSTGSGERINKTESLFSRDDSISPPLDRIVAIITREVEQPGNDKYEEEMDLDLEIELSRNLDACTASDVECQSIDNLVTSESLFSSDYTKVIRRPKKSSSLEVKVPGKLGEILSKKKLKKSQSIDDTAEVVCPHRNEPVNSKQIDIQVNTTTSTLGKSVDTAQEASQNLRAKESPEFADKHSVLRNFETTRNISPRHSKDSELFKYEASLKEPLINEGTGRTVLADSSGSDNEDNYKQTIIRNVRSVEKENTAGLEKRQSIQVLSEEVTSQEIVLKIAWPKQQTKSQSKVAESRKPPFRELQLKRVMRISDLDNPLNVFPKVDTSQPVLAVTQQSPNALRAGLTPLSLPAPQPKDGMVITPAEIRSRVDQTVATRNISEIAVEYVNQTNSRKLEHISDSAEIDVQKTDTVKVLRVPMAAVHKVQGIKDAVAAVGSTILDDFQRQPKKRNIRVTCEAVESKSRASLHDQDVTVIRNTIVDTYGRKPAIEFSSGPKNSVQI